MIYATIFCKSFYRDGVRTRIELVPVHNTNHSVTAAYICINEAAKTCQGQFNQLRLKICAIFYFCCNFLIQINVLYINRSVVWARWRELSPPDVFTPVFPPGLSTPEVSFHAKYVVDENLFWLESPILTRGKRAISRNNVGGEVSLQGGKLLGGENRGEHRGGNFLGGKGPRTVIASPVIGHISTHI